MIPPTAVFHPQNAELLKSLSHALPTSSLLSRNSAGICVSVAFASQRKILLLLQRRFRSTDARFMHASRISRRLTDPAISFVANLLCPWPRFDPSRSWARELDPLEHVTGHFLGPISVRRQASRLSSYTRTDEPLLLSRLMCIKRLKKICE